MLFKYEGNSQAYKLPADVMPFAVACDENWQSAYVVSAFDAGKCSVHAGPIGPLSAMPQYVVSSAIEHVPGHISISFFEDDGVSFTRDGTMRQLKLYANLAESTNLYVGQPSELTQLFACRPEDFTFVYCRDLPASPLRMTPVMTYLTPHQMSDLKLVADGLERMVNWLNVLHDPDPTFTRYIDLKSVIIEIDSLAANSNRTDRGIAVPVSCLNALFHLRLAAGQMGNVTNEKIKFCAERFHTLMRVLLGHGGIRVGKLNVRKLTA